MSGWTDFNSPNVITTSRGTEGSLINMIHAAIQRNKESILEGKMLPEISKEIAWEVDNFYMRLVINSYRQGLEHGFDLREMTFEGIEKRLAKASS